MNSRQLRKHQAAIHNTEFERLKNRTPEERQSEIEESVKAGIRETLAGIKKELF